MTPEIADTLRLAQLVMDDMLYALDVDLDRTFVFVGAGFGPERSVNIATVQDRLATVLAGTPGFDRVKFDWHWNGEKTA